MRDVGVAEELAHNALLAALEQWPQFGVPQNAGAWLTATGKHFAVDHLRRGAMQQRKHEGLAQELEQPTDPAEELNRALDEEVGDDLLRLIFVACHPILARESSVALTLRVLGGLTTEEIGRAFLVAEATIAQRIVRAKRALTGARIPFEVPTGIDRDARMGSVLEVIYLIFNEGHSASVGEDLMRPGLCEDALRLGRVLAALAPLEPEVHGLLALMELHASRSPARLGADGEPVLLSKQNRGLWDRLAIQRGLGALERAKQLGKGPGAYALQAEICACHVRANTFEATDWPRLVALYTELGERMASPIVELNRALAVSMASGPAAGLALLEELSRERLLEAYPLLAAARGDMLSRLGRWSEARIELLRAASLTGNEPQRRLLREQAAECERKA